MPLPHLFRNRGALVCFVSCEAHLGRALCSFGKVTARSAQAAIARSGIAVTWELEGAAVNGEPVAQIGRGLVHHIGTNLPLEMRKRFNPKHDKVYSICIQAKLQI